MASDREALFSSPGWLRLWIAGSLLWVGYVVIWQATHPNKDMWSTVVEGLLAAIVYPAIVFGIALLVRWVLRGFLNAQ